MELESLLAQERPDDEGHEYFDDNDDDEEECRVCRGPAEEGRPLFQPCMCSGTIAMVHQDCLESWLKVQRRDGSCELCRTKFKFAPKYAPNTPLRLSTQQIIISLLRRAIVRWLPLMIRSLFAASLWLIVAPLVTACLYHGWMARPNTILERFETNLLMIDLIGGAVVAICIIVSFLSLMSFADFLRVEWQRQGLVPRPRAGLDRNQVNNNLNENNQQANIAVMDAPNDIRNQELPGEEHVDNVVWENVQQKILENTNRAEYPIVSDENELSSSDDLSDSLDQIVQDDLVGFHEHVLQMDQGMLMEENEANDVDRARMREHERFHFDRMNNPAPVAIERIVLDRNAIPNIPPAALDQEEAIDMDINIALDELLGVRGPLVVVARNLLWLLAFNAVFLGFFAFVPRTVGVAMSSVLFNTTLFSNIDVPGNTTDDIMNFFNISQSFSLTNAWRAIEAENIHQKTTLRLHDVATVALGYFSLAFAVIFFRFLWVISQQVPFLRDRREVNRIVQGLGNGAPIMGEDPPVIALSVALGVALDAMVAIVKVGILLFLKMFLLPIILGLTLDVATIPLFGGTLEGRVAYAGIDLFSFILLHWVAGITFMLVVTVSVLQLREVVHPDLLAQMIRPQEPQPDLLGNLMHESISTHGKRMVLSFIIYAFLLSVHIYLPVRLYDAYFENENTFFKIKLSYILTPQLQVPLELIFFHLCVLALLEKYKNGIGGIQHIWLKYVCEWMGISERILPKDVVRFRLLGTKPVFIEKNSVDPFWFDCSNAGKGAIKLINSKLSTFEPPNQSTYRVGESKPDGERVLKIGSDFLRLPIRLPGKYFRVNSILLPTKVGKYRLTCEAVKNDELSIHLWEEVIGISITRPPEGWDDLGAGGADVQGRWAWGSEKKSTTENGIAIRRSFFHEKQPFVESVALVLKILLLGILSWVAATLVLCLFFTVPLAVGRSIYYILRVPKSWLHDPFAFIMGFLLSFPLLRKLIFLKDNDDVSSLKRLSNWLCRFRMPPLRKSIVLVKALSLWFVIAPLLLGFLYEVMFLKEVDWLTGTALVFDTKSAFLSWILGLMALHTFSEICILGVFTSDFRLLGEARDAVDRGSAANEEAAAWLDVGGGRLRLAWQGKHGRMARFWDTLTAVFLYWEWDKVDETNLIHNSTAPIAFQLLCCSVLPIAVTHILCYVPLKAGVFRAILTRSILVSYCVTQISRVWKDQLHRWFELAHKTARDDRFLIGEVLLNYNE